MSPDVKFSELRDLLTGLGFRYVSLPDASVFAHKASDTLFAFCPYQPSDRVRNYHLLDVRHKLDARGLMPAEAFDSRFKKTPA